MFCPYNTKSSRVVEQYERAPGEEPDTEGYQRITLSTWEMMECPQHLCGAWQQGQCNYKDAIE